MTIGPKNSFIDGSRPSDYTNLGLKQGLKLFSSFGFELPPAVTTALQSGGAGFVPLMGLADDGQQFFKRWGKFTSIGDQLTFSSLGGEVAFDLYELIASVTKVAGFHEIEKTIQSVAPIAMGFRIFAGATLTVCFFDKTLSSYGLIKSRLGFDDKKENPTLLNRAIDIFKTVEAGSATVSNFALLCGGGPNTVYETAAFSSNSAKLVRIFLELPPSDNRTVKIQYVYKIPHKRKTPSPIDLKDKGGPMGRPIRRCSTTTPSFQRTKSNGSSPIDLKNKGRPIRRCLTTTPSSGNGSSAHANSLKKKESSTPATPKRSNLHRALSFSTPKKTNEANPSGSIAKK